MTDHQVGKAVEEAAAKWIRERREAYDDHCGGEPTNPQFFGTDSEDDRAGADGYCRGCWVCWSEEEIAYEMLAAIQPFLVQPQIQRCPSCLSSNPWFTQCNDRAQAEEETGREPSVRFGCTDPWHENPGRFASPQPEDTEELTKIALALKNEGIEDCTPEEGVERLITLLAAYRSGQPEDRDGQTFTLYRLKGSQGWQVAGEDFMPGRRTELLHVVAVGEDRDGVEEAEDRDTALGVYQAALERIAADVREVGTGTGEIRTAYPFGERAALEAREALAQAGLPTQLQLSDEDRETLRDIAEMMRKTNPVLWHRRIDFLRKLASTPTQQGDGSGPNLPPQKNGRGGPTQFGLFVESLRWAVGWIDKHSKFGPEMPSGDASEWLEWAAAHDLLKDADAASTQQGDEQKGGVEE